MSLPEQYLVTTKNLDAFFNSLMNAQAPQKFTLKFLEQLEFKSTNDRLLIGILKALKFIDAESVPQQRYFEFIDQTQSKIVLAEAIKDAYSDLFAVNKNANDLSEIEVKNKFKTLLQGGKSDHVFSLMAKTFRALCDYADFSEEKTKNESLTKNDYEPQFNNSDQSDEKYQNSGHNKAQKRKKELFKN